MRTELFYQNRLTKYFVENYSQYSDVEFFVNPAANQWDLFIPSLKERYLLTCDDNGVVTSEMIENGT